MHPPIEWVRRRPAALDRPTAPGRPVAAALAAVLSAALVAGCGGPSDAELEYAGDYAAHLHLEVTGYPVTETLGLVQQVMWRLADGSRDRLAKLGTTDGGDAGVTSDAWIREYRRGAQGPVTADFQDDPTQRQTVVLTFHDTGQVKELLLRPAGRDGGDGWQVVLR
ncbi:hypothetical protein [Kitasatospora sp. NPDC051705]|uniref:hypothetical protein n=1 Tax=Kitasatospora sp. NPDC051705 TaxID=3364057 RepID=UPI0037B87CB2